MCTVQQSHSPERYDIMENSAASPAILTFTPAALQALESMLTQLEVPEDYALRVGMHGGGCGGMSYLLGFDSAKPEDQHHTIQGWKVLIDRRQGMYVLGMEIDYLDEGDRQGFVFHNPQVREAALEEKTD